MSEPTRLPLIGDGPADPTLARVFTQVEGAVGEVPNLYRTLGHAPWLLDRWIDFAWALRLEAVTDRALRELMIMRNAQLSGADYEWRHHWPMAIDAGVDEAKLHALGEWTGSALFSPVERAVLTLVDEVTPGGPLSDAAWAALAEHFAPGEIVELVMTVAFYCCVSRVLGALQPPVEDAYREVPPAG